MNPSPYICFGSRKRGPEERRKEDELIQGEIESVAKRGAISSREYKSKLLYVSVGRWSVTKLMVSLNPSRQVHWIQTRIDSTVGTAESGGCDGGGRRGVVVGEPQKCINLKLHTLTE